MISPRLATEALPATGAPATVIRHPNPYLAFAKLVELFYPAPERTVTGVHPGASVSAEARLGRDVNVGFGACVEAGATIGDRVDLGPLCYDGRDVRIGDETRLNPHVTLYAGVEVGRRCILHSGAVIGADGFGYAQEGGIPYKIPQRGTVVLEDEVEIGANTTIDRAVLGATRIGRGTKIDNLVQIGHNCEIGEGSILVSQCGVSGSTKLGRRVTLAAQAGLVGHIELGDGAIVGAQAGVTKDVPAGQAVLGSPAVPFAAAKRALALVEKLPEIRKEVRELAKRLEEIEKRVTPP